MSKTASTRQIIEYLQAYEKIHGIGSIDSIGSVCSGSRDTEYIFYIEDKNDNETRVEIPTMDKGDIWNENK